MTKVERVDGEDGTVGRKVDLGGDYIDIGEGQEMIRDEGADDRRRRRGIENCGDHMDRGLGRQVG